MMQILYAHIADDSKFPIMIFEDRYCLKKYLTEVHEDFGGQLEFISGQKGAKSMRYTPPPEYSNKIVPEDFDRLMHRFFDTFFTNGINIQYFSGVAYSKKDMGKPLAQFIVD